MPGGPALPGRLPQLRRRRHGAVLRPRPRLHPPVRGRRRRRRPAPVLGGAGTRRGRALGRRRHRGRRARHADVVRRDRRRRPRDRRGDGAAPSTARRSPTSSCSRARSATSPSRDGTVVQGWLVRDPDATGPPPLLLDIHGGPHNAWNGAADEIHLYHQELAARGWTVLLVNPRGSDGYGEEFYDARPRRLGRGRRQRLPRADRPARRRGPRRPGAAGGHRLQLRRLHDLLPDQPRRPVRGGGRRRRGQRPDQHGRHLRRRPLPRRLRARRLAVARPRPVRRDVAAAHGRPRRHADAGPARRGRPALPGRPGPAVAHRAARARRADPAGALPGRLARVHPGRAAVAPARLQPAASSTGSSSTPATRPARAGRDRRRALAAAPRRAGRAARAFPARSSASCGCGPGRDDELVEAAHGAAEPGRPGVAATTDSVFQIGSITKVWTATVVMQLVDEGLLDLDAPVAEVLPELRLADPDVDQEVTIRHLLTHTSGIDGDVFTDTGRGDDCLEKYVGAARRRGAEPPARRHLVLLQLRLLARSAGSSRSSPAGPGTRRCASGCSRRSA